MAADRALDLEPFATGKIAQAQREIVHRHSAIVRSTHWINALCLMLLLMSGLRILAAHPALYWGNYGYYGVPSLISISDRFDDATAHETGVTRIGDYDLPVQHGAPLRLRVERQIGYKHAKYIARIEAVDRLDHIGLGRGGYWPDRGYQRYAGL